MSIKEILPDNENYVDDNGDVKHIDKSMGEIPSVKLGKLVKKYVHFPVDVNKTKKVDFDSGVSVDLVESVPYEKNALKKYLHASELNGYVQKMNYVGRFDEASKINRSENSSRKEGDVELARIFGFEVMKSIGYDLEELELEAQKSAREFYNRYTGPNNKERRTKLRNGLEKQIKLK